MDGLRGILAVYVMLGHALPFTALPGWLDSPFSHGEAAVDLFFALSGLVIINSLERFGYAFRPFIAARARRLLPVYFVVLAAATLLLLAGPPALPWVGADAWHIMEPGPPPHLFWHLAAHVFLVQGLIPQGALPYAYVTLLGPAWSLSTEWQFYVLIGLVAPRRLGRFALCLLAVGVVYHLLHLPPWWQFSRAFLPDAAPFFALGLASAVALRGGGWMTFVVCLITACALNGAEKALVPLAWGLAMLAQKARWGTVLEHPAVQYLGAISYPLYLVNEPVQRGLAMLIHGDAVTFTMLWLPLSVVVSLAAAAALHEGMEVRQAKSSGRFFEKKLRKKLL